MQHISWEDAPERCYVIGPYLPPIATVSLGEMFRVETLDAFGNRVTGPDTPPTKVLSLPYVNPVTGHIYGEGAEKGNTLSVTIHDLKPARDFGVSATIPEFGGLCGTSLTRTLNEPLPERVWIHPITDDGIIFDPNLDIPKIPLEPFYGTMGTAPIGGHIHPRSRLARRQHGRARCLPRQHHLLSRQGCWCAASPGRRSRCPGRRRGFRSGSRDTDHRHHVGRPD